MKKALPLLIGAAFALAGCRGYQGQSDIVKETFIHKYGVPVSQSDWEQQGMDGQTVRLRKDGVTVTTSYSRGVVHGVTTYTYPNSSTVRNCETYNQGELVSEKENFPSGVSMVEKCYENQALTKLTRWYEDGSPQAYEVYQEGFLLTGEYRTPLNVVETRVIDGHGTRLARSNEGELLAKDTIQNGQMRERITFFPNGDPSSVSPYENGVIHGTRLTFQQGGLPNTVEQWIHGMQEGTTVVYQNGEKIAEIAYQNNKKDGPEYRYRDGSILMEEITWKEDSMHGPRKLYVDGEPKTEWYHDGELVSRPTFERMNLPRKAA